MVRERQDGARGRRVYPAALGAAIGAVLAGLVMPLVISERPESVSSSAAETGPVGSGDDRGAVAPNRPTSTASSPAEAPRPAIPSAGLPSSTSASDPAEGSTLAVSEVGVSATTITWGFMLLDVGATRGIPGAAVVGIDPEQQRRAIRIYVDDINNRGGINGRTVDAVFVNADATTEDDQRAGCLELTQDHKVFAVVANGGLYPSALSCVTRENGTPLLTDGGRGTPTELYHQSGGLLFTLHQAGTRLMTNWVARLDELGALGARKIGVVSDEGNDPGDRMVGGGLIPALKQFGHEVTHRTRLQADVSVAASQIPLEVQQMRAKGVNTVFLATQARNAAQFVGEAQAQQWSPAWMATDYANVCSDVTGGTMTANFDGAICVSATRIGDWRVGHPEPPDDARCRVQYEKATGEALPRNNGNSSNTTYTITIAFCGLMRILETAAQEAGAELTRPRLSAAMQRLGAIALPNMGGGSFAGGKFDAADVARTVRYRTSCRCWTPDGDFHRSRF